MKRPCSLAVKATSYFFPTIHAQAWYKPLTGHHCFTARLNTLKPSLKPASSEQSSHV